MPESANETRRVEAATSPPSVGSPPQSHVCREAAQGEEEEAGRSAAEKATPMEVVRTLPASPPSPPPENLDRELFPIRHYPILPGADRAEQYGAEGDEPDRLVEEFRAAARRAAVSAEVRCHPLAV